MQNPLMFVQQVRDELTRVSWPSRKAITEMSMIVILVSVVVGLYIGGLDTLFTTLIDWVLTQG